MHKKICKTLKLYDFFLDNQVKMRARYPRNIRLAIYKDIAMTNKLPPKKFASADLLKSIINPLRNASHGGAGFRVRRQPAIENDPCPAARNSGLFAPQRSALPKNIIRLRAGNKIFNHLQQLPCMSIILAIRLIKGVATKRFF
ncbi:MAG TPA: hypothetical protein ENN66_07855 [Proteobacteria bacterium]|nr:hypothetical protein [Pseudomonadota bacterium]